MSAARVSAAHAGRRRDRHPDRQHRTPAAAAAAPARKIARSRQRRTAAATAPKPRRRITGGAGAAMRRPPTRTRRTACARRPTIAPPPPIVTAAPAAGAGEEPPYRVLIVEDDRARRCSPKACSTARASKPSWSPNRATCMRAMARMQPDLVLMDLHMPGPNGTELTALIRQQEAFLHTPIVFLTGDPDPETQFEVLEVGADDFLQKPIRPRHLIAAVESRVKRARALGRQRSRIQPPPGHRPAGAPAPAAAPRRRACRRTRGGVFFIEVEGSGHAARALRLRRARTPADRSRAAASAASPAAIRPRASTTTLPDLYARRDEAAARSAGARLRDGIGSTRSTSTATRCGCALTVGFAALQPRLRRCRRCARSGRTGRAPGAHAATRRRAPRTSRRIARRRQRPAAYLRDALDDDRFELLYQPIVAVAGSDVAQYQTLLRLRATDGKLHNAAEIVPAAERGRLIARHRPLGARTRARRPAAAPRAEPAAAPVRAAVAAHAGARRVGRLAARRRSRRAASKAHRW